MRLPDWRERLEAYEKGEGGSEMKRTLNLAEGRRTIIIDGLVVIDEQINPPVTGEPDATQAGRFVVRWGTLEWTVEGEDRAQAFAHGIQAMRRLISDEEACLLQDHVRQG